MDVKEKNGCLLCKTFDRQTRIKHLNLWTEIVTEEPYFSQRSI